MALSQTSPETNNTIAADEVTVSAPVPVQENTTREISTSETPPPAAAANPEDEVLKIDGLYDSASRLEVEFEGVVRRSMVSLTQGQVGAYNAVLKLARQLIPKSIALREDVDEVDSETRPVDAHQALHVTIVPTLHNALPEPLYNTHG